MNNRLDYLQSIKIPVLMVAGGLVLILVWNYLAVRILVDFGTYGSLLVLTALVPATFFLVARCNAGLHALPPVAYGFQFAGVSTFFAGALAGSLLFSLGPLLSGLIESNLISAEGLFSVPGQVMLLHAVSAFIVGVSEEGLFRALVFIALFMNTRNILFSILVSSALFATSHMIIDRSISIWILALFGFGIIFAYVYYRTGNFWLIAGLHAGFNFMSSWIQHSFLFDHEGMTNRNGGLQIQQWVLTAILVTIATSLIVHLVRNPKLDGKLKESLLD